VTMYVEIKTNALGKILVFLLTTLILMVNLWSFVSMLDF
jgi:hypothetical protein